MAKEFFRVPTERSKVRGIIDYNTLFNDQLFDMLPNDGFV